MTKAIYYNPSTMEDSYDEGLALASKIVRSQIYVDRSGKSNVLDIAYDKIPALDDRTSLSFYDAITNSATEFWGEARDRPITLSWSGGLDSTAALFALKETTPVGQKLILRFTEGSIEEYPWLYNKMRGWQSKDFVFNQVTEKQLFRDFEDDIFLIHGQNVDCLFGSSSPWLQTLGTDNFAKVMEAPWYTIDDWDIIWATSGDKMASQDMSLNEDHSKRLKVMDFLEHHIKQAPYEIIDIQDLYWWLAFSLKWHWLQHCFVFAYNNSPNYQSQHDIACGKDLQLWSIMNRNKKHKGTWLSYKFELKDFIYRFTKDADYRDNKVKEKSLIPINEKNLYPHIRTKHGDDKLKLVLDDGRYWLNGDTIPTEVIDKLQYCLDK